MRITFEFSFIYNFVFKKVFTSLAQVKPGNFFIGETNKTSSKYNETKIAKYSKCIQSIYGMSNSSEAVKINSFFAPKIKKSMYIIPRWNNNEHKLNKITLQ